MAFTIADAQDLVRLLREHPEWRDDVRRELLGPDYLPLPQLVRENAKAISELTADVRVMQAEGVEFRRRMDEFNVRMDEFSKRQDEHSARMDEFSKRMDEFSKRQDEHSAYMKRIFDVELPKVWKDVNWLKGEVLEGRYQAHPARLTGSRLRRPRVVSPFDLDGVDAAWDAGVISDADRDALAALDILIAGREGSGAEAREAFVAVEVSFTVDDNDVERAADRAEILRRVGYTVHAAVAGELAAESAIARARARGVDIYLQGRLYRVAS